MYMDLPVVVDPAVKFAVPDETSVVEAVATRATLHTLFVVRRVHYP